MVIQQTLLNGNPDIKEIPLPPERLDKEECRMMIRRKQCNQGTLTKNNNVFQTHNKVPINPPNRIMSFLSNATQTKKDKLHSTNNKSICTLWERSSNHR